MSDFIPYTRIADLLDAQLDHTDTIMTKAEFRELVQQILLQVAEEEIASYKKLMEQYQ